MRVPGSRKASMPGGREAWEQAWRHLLAPPWPPLWWPHGTGRPPVSKDWMGQWRKLVLAGGGGPGGESETRGREPPELLYYL